MRSKRQYSDFFTSAKKTMNLESIRRAERKAENILLNLKLADLRKKIGLKQTEVPGFSQTSISRIETREDLKLSTLIGYINALGMDIEIRAVSKSKKRKREKDRNILILKS